MSKIQKIVNEYNKICHYCDGFWKRTVEKFPGAITCVQGCSTCCELQSVNFLEAYIIAEYGADNNCATIKPPRSGNACPFLDDNRCRIYPARPLICRTHGLLLKSKDFADRMSASCPLNFTAIGHAAISDADALDIDRITDNLARLNAAFCMLLGDIKKTKERIALCDLAAGKISRSRFAV